jgi:hypothetical protein
MLQEKACTISIIVPVYKEEKNIPPFLERMERVLAETGFNVGFFATFLSILESSNLSK